MSSASNPSESNSERVIDELAYELIDNVKDKGDTKTCDDVELTSEEKKRLADHLWMDALMLHAHGKLDDSIDAAVTTTLRRLRDGDQQPQPTTTRRSRLQTSRRVVLALAALIAFFWLSMFRSVQPPTAFAMLDRAYEAMLKPKDRKYVVQIERPGRSPIRELKLEVRGSESFLLTAVGPLGQPTKIGHDKSGYWFAPAIGPVMVSRTDGIVANWLDRSALDMPYLELPTLMQRLRSRYELTGQPEPQANTTGPELFHIIATKKTSDGDPLQQRFRRAPDRVELWTEIESGVVTKMILESDDVRRKITIELVEQTDQRKDYYDPKVQSAGRVVLNAPE